MTMLIDIIAGARPNFIKIAPIIAEIKKVKSLSYRLIHTGQHYDHKMSGSFFNDLDIPEPDVNLGVKSGTQAEQTGKIMIEYEKCIFEKRPDICLVVGDVNSTMAASLAAKKMGIKVAHVEAGIRSGDLSMPEEINRIVTDSISDYFFTTTKEASNNLIKSGIKKDNVFFVGNTMIDTLKMNLSKLRPPKLYDELNLCKQNYFVTTLHRPSNVDNVNNLAGILHQMDIASNGNKIIFPLHPRTRIILEKGKLNYDNIIYTEPLSYLEFIFLVKNSQLVITDSGGISEETTYLGIPCITLRDTTERPETCKIGTNVLVGNDLNLLHELFQLASLKQWKIGGVPKFWDGKTSSRIIKSLTKLSY